MDNETQNGIDGIAGVVGSPAPTESPIPPEDQPAQEPTDRERIGYAFDNAVASVRFVIEFVRANVDMLEMLCLKNGAMEGKVAALESNREFFKELMQKAFTMIEVQSNEIAHIKSEVAGLNAAVKSSAGS